MLQGIQTGAWQPLEVLEQLYVWNHRIIRLDYDRDTKHAAQVITMARDVGFAVLFLVRDTKQIPALRQYLEPPLRISGPNEPDLNNSGKLSTRSYRAWIERAAPLCETAGFELWAPVISNLNDRGFKYLREVWKTLAGLPAVGVDVHRYAPFNSALDPQQGSVSRADEIRRLKDVIGTRKWGVSEFGYSTAHMNPYEQRHEWAVEFAFADTTDAAYWIAYQLNRSQADQYGVREPDGRWLPAASVLATASPEPPQVIPMRESIKTAIADSVVNFRDGHIDHGFEQRPVDAVGTDETCGLVLNDDDTWSILSPNGQQWLSIQPDGRREARPASGAPGAWEKFTGQGHVLTEQAKGGVTRPLVQFIVKDLVKEAPPTARPEHGPLRTRGTDFIDEHDQPWQFRGYTVHLVMCRIKKGEDARPILKEAKGYGANTLVTIGTHLSDWKKEHGFYLNPRDPGYAELLAQTFDLAAEEEMRVAHAVLADVQGRSREEQRWIWDLSCEVAKNRWNVLLRLGNEYNVNGWSPGDFTLPDLGGVLASRGSSGINNPPWPAYWQWAEWEGPREPMPKAMGDAGAGMLYLTEGYRDEATGQMIGPFPCPLVCIEPPYFHESERDQWGDKRWTSQRDALRLGGNIGVNSAGGAFGSSQSLEAQPNGPIAAECARKFFRGLKAGFVR